MSTVAAIGTPIGKGGVSMIRISGESAHLVAESVFRAVNEKRFSEKLCGRTYYGRFFDGDGFFDDGLTILYSAKNSFTGEESAELFCHGGLLVTRRLLEAVLTAGAEPAGPGEFTKRAFINGRISLTGAEAIGGIIDAVSPRHLEVAAGQAAGSLSAKIGEIEKKLVRLCASVYAFIDYPDEDMTDVTVEEMKPILSGVLSQLNTLLSTRNYGKAISDGLSVAIVGKPNTGKSSLLNLLCREDRAIVTDVAGTTRDVITERVMLGDLVLNLSDTAGIRDSGDVIEQMGIQKSIGSLKNAELVMAVFDCSRSRDAEDDRIIAAIDECGKRDSTLCIMNKNDLSDSFGAPPFKNCLYLSAKDGDCLDMLAEKIKQTAAIAPVDRDAEIITNARQFSALKKAALAVESALEALESFTQDVACMDIERALAALDEADGRSVSEEIVNEIFSHFCVGK